MALLLSTRCAYLSLYYLIVFLFLPFQLILATVPGPGQEKSPSILTDDNIKLLFEIQKKVIVNSENVFG